MLNRRTFNIHLLLIFPCLLIILMLSYKLPSLALEPEVNLFERLEQGRVNTVAKQPIVIIDIWGHKVYFDRRSKTLLKPPGYFEKLFSFSEGLARVVRKGKVGFINERGQWVIKPRFSADDNDSRHDYNLNFHEGAAIIKIDDKYGFVNRQGKLFTSTNFDFARPFNQGVAVVIIDGKYGLINQRGRFIISPQLTEAPMGDFAEGGLLVRRNNQENCINKQGRIIEMVACQYIKNESGYENSYAFRVDKGAVYFNGKLFPNQHWDRVTKSRGFETYRGLYIYQVDGKWGIVHESGKIITPPQFDVLLRAEMYLSYYFNNGLALVKINGKYGFIDETGGFVIEPKLERASPFEFDAEITTAMSGGKIGYIDRRGKFIIPPQFTEAFPFDRRFGSLARVKVNNKYGFIDRQGKMVIPAQFDEIFDQNPFSSVGVLNYYDSFYNDGLVPARRGKKWVYLNAKAVVGIPQQFDAASGFHYGIAEVQSGVRTFYIDRKGKILPF
jgi:WG containing repeat